jgi:hypothetical protein
MGLNWRVCWLAGALPGGVIFRPQSGPGGRARRMRSCNAKKMVERRCYGRGSPVCSARRQLPDPPGEAKPGRQDRGCEREQVARQVAHGHPETSRKECRCRGESADPSRLTGRLPNCSNREACFVCAACWNGVRGGRDCKPVASLKLNCVKNVYDLRLVEYWLFPMKLR